MQMTLLFMPQLTATWKSDDRHVVTCQTMSSNMETGLVNEMHLIGKTWLNHFFHLMKFNLTTIMLAKDNAFPIQNMLSFQNREERRDIGQEDRYHRQDKGL